MSAMVSQIPSLMIVYSTVYSKRRSKKTSKLRVTGLCVEGIHRWPVNSPHQAPVTRKMFPFDDVIKGTSAAMLMTMSYVHALHNNCFQQPVSSPCVQYVIFITGYCHFPVNNISQENVKLLLLPISQIPNTYNHSVIILQWKNVVCKKDSYTENTV